MNIAEILLDLFYVVLWFFCVIVLCLVIIMFFAKILAGNSSMLHLWYYKFRYRVQKEQLNILQFLNNSD
jgi:hypothetical protein